MYIKCNISYTTRWRGHLFFREEVGGRDPEVGGRIPPTPPANPTLDPYDERAKEAELARKQWFPHF